MDENRIIAAAISQTPLDAAEAQSQVWTEAAGAVVVFSGVVRNHDDGRRVERLSYTAHPSAEARLHEAALECAQAHPGVRIWVAHRVGDLAIGDNALVAACASAHRAESFAACQDLVETVKQTVPIWKEQFYQDGTKSWVGLP